jgi:methylglutaconyl-CoA hydratase
MRAPATVQGDRKIRRSAPMRMTAEADDGEAPNVSVAIDGRGVATVVMNRPRVRNAWNPALVRELTDAFERLAADDRVRVAIVTGAGQAFSAGGDLAWMRGILDASEEERRTDAQRIQRLMETMDRFPKPLIAKVNGPAFGGGCGMVCVADVAIGSEDARFGLSEVRVGVIPALISPFVLRRLGLGTVRAHLYGGASVSAQTAVSIGLLRSISRRDGLDDAVEAATAEFLACAPQALAATKALLREVAEKDAAAGSYAAFEALMAAWRGGEAAAGLSAFLEKRPPPWVG